MKKILVALALMMGAICVNAQEHLKFKGVPIDGTLESFTRQLEAKGYTREAYGGDVQVMKGDEVIGDTLEYSVMKYCLNQIEKSKKSELVAVCKAMLNYAAASQLSFDYNTDNLANASLSDADKVLPEVDASAYKYNITGTEEGIKASSATLMLESEVKIRVYFKLTGDKSIDEFTFTIDGVTKTVTPGDTMLKTDGVVHGCTCLEAGILLDIFTPMREDFVK